MKKTYVTVEEADEYFCDSLNEQKWLEYDEKARQSALVSAQRLIDRQCFIGRACIENCAFPRVIAGKVFFEPPQAVKDAVCEQALRLLLQKENGISFDIEDMHIQSVSLGDASVTYKESVSSSLCSSARELMSGWLRSGFDISQSVFEEIY